MGREVDDEARDKIKKERDQITSVGPCACRGHGAFNFVTFNSTEAFLILQLELEWQMT